MEAGKASAADPKSAAGRQSESHFGRLGAVTWLIVGACGVLLYVAHAAFIPVALALLFALVLSGPVEALHRLRVPRSLSAALLVVIVLSCLTGVADLMWAPAQQWYKTAPQTVQTVRHKLAPAARFIAHAEDLLSSASSIGGSARPGSAAAPEPANADKSSAPVLILDATRGWVASVATFVIITLFLLTGGPPMLARMTAAFVDDLNAGHVLHVIERVRAEVGRFYVTTALINVGLGCATAAAMYFCGMPTPYLWGIIAGMFNFVPYAGSAATLIVVTLVALVTFDGLGRVMLVSGCYLALATLEGQIVQPLFVGRRLAVNPLLVFLALWFGGLFWGIAGVILATPSLVALKVVAEHAIGGQAVLTFLGPNDQRPVEQQGVGRLLKPVIRVARAAVPHP